MSDPLVSLDRKHTNEAAAVLRENPDLHCEVAARLSGARKPSPPESMSAPFDESPLAGRIREIVLDSTVPPFDKRRNIAGLVERELLAQGEFLRTSDGHGFYFQRAERQLYDINEDYFQRLLTETSGLSITENFFKFALDILQTKILRTAHLAEVHSFSFFDVTSGLLAVSDGGAGIWRRERGGRWELGRNGDGGIFFLADLDATAWTPDFADAGDAETWWLDNFLFAADGVPVEDSRALLLLWTIQQFFPPLRRTRVIPCFLGGQGSGKTTAMRLIGRLLVGKNFDVTGVSRDKEDAFVAAVSNRAVLGLDNVDSKIPWLADTLALYATGQRYRLRKLYSTNTEVSYSPRAILLLSSRDPRFNRPDVTERLLPLNFSRPGEYLPEESIFSELEKRRGQIMGSLLVSAGQIADELALAPLKPLPFRMADFASFGHRVFSAAGKSSEFVLLLERLEKRQAEFASEGDGLIETLRILLEQKGGSVELAVGELFKECSALAETQGSLFPKSVQSFGQRLTSLHRVIELELGVKFTEERGHQNHRVIRLARKGATLATPEMVFDERGVDTP